MDPAKSHLAPQSTINGPANPVNASHPINPAHLSTSTPHSGAKGYIPPSPWSSQAMTVPTTSNSGPLSFTNFSASTAELLKRLHASNSNATGTAAFEAKRAEVLQNFVTSDKLPTPPPVANSGRRGRGGKTGTPVSVKTDTMAGTMGTTPASGRGSGRGRGRGRGGGRGGKRKRAESVESDDDDSDISSSYTPLPTRTKSGRNVNKPVAFVPTIPEPSQVKRRRSTKTILAAQCKLCHRGTDPANNRIVFCDLCATAYHQYCHDPPIDNEVVSVLEKEWLCGPCNRSKQVVVEGTDGLVAAPEGLTIDDKRAYLSTLPQARLVSLLLHATIRHPELPIFPLNVQDMIPDPSAPSTHHPVSANRPLPIPRPGAYTSNGHTGSTTGGTPRSMNLTTSTNSEMDPAEAQLLGEINHSSKPRAPGQPAAVNNNNNAMPSDQMDEYDDGYDTDPPAHYPKAGNGLARTLKPMSEDMQWLVDDNFEVFSHGWRGDGSGVAADGTLNGMEGVERRKA